MPPCLRASIGSPFSSSFANSHKSHKLTLSARRTATTLLRRQFRSWLETIGENYKYPLPTSTNYISARDPRTGRLTRVETFLRTQASRGDGDKNAEGSSYTHFIKNSHNELGTERLPVEQKKDLRPFPNNPNFNSESVLSDELRENVWKRVVVEGKSVKLVSAELGIDMNRVGAVVRLMEVQKAWEKQNRPLAIAYSNAILEMIPTTPLTTPHPTLHESINDLPMHASTAQQIFLPTSESRQFNRQDAAKTFSRSLLPADKRIPHPELIDLERERLQGLSMDERIRRQVERDERLRQQQSKRAEEAKAEVKVVKPETGGSGRWEWRFEEVRVDAAGKDGRGAKGVGWRYGLPHEDRKKGQIKIPQRVV